MFIDFLSFTNDAVLDHSRNDDISFLDQSVLHILDINIDSNTDCYLNRLKHSLVCFGETGGGPKAQEKDNEQGSDKAILARDQR